MQDFFAAMDDVVLVLNCKGTILKILSPNASQLHQPSTELLGQWPWDSLRVGQAARGLTCVQQTLTTGQTQDCDYSLSVGGQERWFHAKCSPLTAETVLWVARDISDRKQVELALQQDEAKFQELATASPAVIFTLLVSIENIVQFEYLSPAAEELHEIPIADLLQDGSVIANQIHPDDRAGYNQAMIHSLETLQPFQYEWRIITPSGKIKWLQANSRAQRRENGELVWHGIAIDISDRKQAEVALKQALKELNYHIENSPLATVRWDREFRVEYWSNRAEEIFGWTAAEVLGKTMYDWRFIVEDDQDQVNQIAAQLLKGVSSVSRNRNYHKDGSIVYCEWYNSVLVDEAGNLISMLSLAQDISDRKQTEAALQQSEARFQTLVKNMPGMLYRYFPSEKDFGLFTYVSSGSYELLELEPDQILHDANAAWSLVHPDDFPSLQASVNLAVQHHLPWQWEGRLTTPSGQAKWIQGSSRPQQTCDGLAWDGLLIDISDRKHLEQELVKNRDFRELLFNESSDALFLVDADTLLTVDCNQRAVEMFEMDSKADLMNIKGHLLQKRQFTAEECAIIQKTVEQKGFWNLEVEYVTHQGREFWGDISVKPITFGEQRFQLVRVVDISDRKQTEAALQQAKQQLEARIEDLNQRNREMVLLGQMSDFLQACLTVEEAYRTLANLVEPLFPNCSGGIFIIGPSRNWVRNVSHWGTDLHSEKEFDLNDCWALRRGQVHWVKLDRLGLRCNHIPKQEAIAVTLCIPMIAQGETLGLFYLSAEQTNDLSDAKQQLARTVAEQVALAIANLNLRETLQQQSIHDPLTGLFNRRYLEESLTQEIARAQRKQHSIGVIMLDIDHFKQFNDTYGHDAGDYVLQIVGTLLKDSVRGSDIACRYGGEEMILILPESPLEETHRRAEEIRQAIAQLMVSHHGQSLGSLTASLGVASFPQHGAMGKTVIQAVDAALYRAKAAGRNQVGVAML